MARVGVHIEAELSGAADDLDNNDQSHLFDEVRNVLEVYFAKMVGGVPGPDAKVKSLVIDYGKLGKKAKPVEIPEVARLKPGYPIISPNVPSVPALGFNPDYPYVTWNSGRTVTKGDE